MNPNVAIFLGSIIALVINLIIIAAVTRLFSIEQHLRKATILLTIIANRQGATEEDVKVALGQ